MKKLFTLISVFLASVTFGQEFQLLEDYLRSLSNSGKSTTLGTPDKTSVKQLLFDPQPAFVLSNQSKQKLGNVEAVVIRTDYASIDKLGSIPDAKSVKAIIISLDKEPVTNVQLGQLLKQQMPALQYVYVDCEFQAKATTLQQYIQADLPNVVFLYAVNIPQ